MPGGGPTGGVVEISGDLGLAYRDPWGFPAGVVPVSVDQSHLDASNRRAQHGFVKQLMPAQPI
jgi:hypothetical protein